MAATTGHDIFEQQNSLVVFAMEVTGGANTRPAKNRVENIATIGPAVDALIPPTVVSECALYLGTVETCFDISDTFAIADAMDIKPSSPQETIAHARKELDCDSDRCIVEKLTPKLGAKAKHIINTKFKVKGPTDAALLSNVTIDKTLQQWAAHWKEFFPYNFNMLNYASYRFTDGEILHEPDTLATIKMQDLWNRGVRCCACVINSDTYQGPGKHWMTLFADMRGPEWSVEFFNSSGNAPAPEWVNWMVKTQLALESIAEKQPGAPKVTVNVVSTVRHQKSKSECGVYSLVYIWARLNGVPYTYFATNSVEDKLMFEFRQHLFADKRDTVGSQFDWNKYQAEVDIKWEK